MKRKKPLPQPATTTIQSLSHEGRGVAQIDGKTVFIDNALPGETVTFDYTRRKNSFDEGKATVIQNRSEHRATPKCSVFDLCGGCSLQHMDMPSQLSLKQKTLLEQLKHFGQVQAETVLLPLSANDWGYRRKARLGVRYIPKKEKVLVGFRETNGRYITNTEQCEVLHASIGTKIEALSELIRSLDAYDNIPQIEVAAGDDVTALIFRHLIELSEEDKTKLVAFGKEHGFHIYCQPKNIDSIYLLSPENHPERVSYHLPKHDITMQFHPSDFTQINHELNQKMIDLAIQQLDIQPDDRVLDLFCGIGNFSLPLARYAKHVTGVEGSIKATDRANENAKKNGLTNVEFHTANLEEPCNHLPWANQTYDKCLLDPARTGAETILPLINELKPSVIVYVSCNPSTLARDAGILVNTFGYTLKQCGIMNMFPHTKHVESIATFVK
ncbi:MAG: 23S rRNA (uracil(1939)-C(5))-methyltransferase RlmD [Gammaproteobacteria bacterium]